MTSGRPGSALTADLLAAHDPDGSRDAAKICRAINLARGSTYKVAYIETLIRVAIAARDPRFPPRRIGRPPLRRYFIKEEDAETRPG